MRRRRRLIVLLAAALILAFGLFSSYGLLTRVRLERQRSALLDSIQLLTQTHDSLLQRSRRLQYDSTEIERLARENYGMAKPNEQVYIVRDPEEKHDDPAH